MVSFTTKALGAAVAALGLFLIIRGAGQKLDNLSLPDVNLPGLPSLPSLPDISLPSLPGIPSPAESIRVADDSPFFTDVEPARQIVQPEGSSVRITQGQPPVFVGGSEVLGPAGEVIPPALTGGLANFINNITNNNREPEAEFIQQLPSEQPFVGGGIFDTPISRLSLGQIVDQFDVTASQAADLQARAQNDFGGFDFGTNTGLGIGGIASQPDINTELAGGNVSNQDFAGLSPTEIAQRLTGGNISNF